MTSRAHTNNIGKMGGRERESERDVKKTEEESKANFTMEYNIDSPTNWRNLIEIEVLMKSFLR